MQYLVLRSYLYLGLFLCISVRFYLCLGRTPCVGAFLGSALMLASQQGHVLEGVRLLLVYSAGLGVAFIISALLIDYIKSAFNWIKQHYKIIKIMCGALTAFYIRAMAKDTSDKPQSIFFKKRGKIV